jgi:hypothetical protein
MAQIVNGVLLGNGVYDFVANTVPTASTDPNVANCSNGSTYRNVNGTTGSTLFVKVGGSWVNLA